MSRSTPDPYSEQYPELCDSIIDSADLLTLRLSSPPLTLYLPLCLPLTCLSSNPSFLETALATLESSLILSTCPTCTLSFSLPRARPPPTVFLAGALAYLGVCALATVYDVMDRYRKELARMKLSKVQR